MIEMKADYRQVMAYQIYCAIGILVLPFSLLALARDQLLLSLPPLLTAVLCIINMIWLKRYSRFAIPAVIISLLYSVDVLLAIHQLGVMGAFWAFPTMMALYWVHERRIAVQVVSFFYVAVCLTAWWTFSLETTIRLAATLLTTAVFFNIAAGVLEKHHEELRKLSVTDHLTGAFNRRYMDSRIDELIERQRRQQSCAALITLDIDHFKQINDRYGHSVGDRILVEVVEIIRGRVRVLDSVCRSGGEEFVVILPDTGEAQARSVGDALRLGISRAALLQDRSVTVSCGVSALVPGDDRDSWLRRCDQALYAAKRSGRDTVAVPELSVAPAEALGEGFLAKA